MDGIVVLGKKNSGCDYHRIYQPFKYLGVDVYANEKEKLSTLLEKAKVVVFNRWAGFDIIHLLRRKKMHGFKIVVDLDDYWQLYSNHVLYNSWKASNMEKNIKEAIFNADLVTVTTSRLADVVKKINKNVEILPNGLPFGHEQFTYDNEQSHPFQFVYTAGSSHFWDLLSIKNVFYKIAREQIKKDFQFSLAGYNDKTPDSKKVWDAMENIGTASGKLNFIRRESLPLESYMKHYEGASCAIAPLEGNYFNGFKSNLKILEAGCKNIPIITSDVAPYSDEPSDCFLRASSINEWYTAISYFLKNPEYAKQLGWKLGEYVRKNYDLLKINEKRKQIFEHLCNT